MNISDPLHYLRKERNLLLSVTDWEMIKALENGSDATALKEYRQALRDLPKNSPNAKWSDGNLTEVEWPTKPE